ncbi:hypothetical protein C9374_012164 [Naegleria lovaniensis]|uniref:Amino acid transporter transmembrane domain-containing protein n=1 Tax=Naegleria lovaniensis TaxID=51637 RepID=A0AA88G7Y5_NAELO|nr:uncharacterized protein C9374_012164 [Naegleria lovaniensis]KAG2373425.1 hypothetical protein C9374_012164 [Naegleria lovaniensis]
MQNAATNHSYHRRHDDDENSRQEESSPTIAENIFNDADDENIPVNPKMETLEEEKHLSSNASALINIIKANIGSGILGMPYAFKCAGYWLGLFSIVIIMLIVVHCTILLVDSKRYLNNMLKKKRKKKDEIGIVVEDEISISQSSPTPSIPLSTSNTPPTVEEKEIITFNDIGYAAFGRTATVVITFFLFVTQLGFCCAYLTFISSNLMNIFGTPTTLGWKALFIFITGVAVFPFCCIRNLKYLSPVSIISEIMIILGVGIVLYFAFDKLASEPFPGLYRNLRPYNFEQFATFFGICLFAFEGVGLVLPIESNMRDKKAYPMLLFVGMIIICASMILLGIVGYLAYGMGVNSLITFNLPADGALPLIIKIFLIIALLFTYPIQLFPISQMMDSATTSIATWIRHKIHKKTTTTELEVAQERQEEQHVLLSQPTKSGHNSINNSKSESSISDEKQLNSLFDSTTTSKVKANKSAFHLLTKACISPTFHLENFIRFMMIMATVFFSAFIPSFGDFLGLIGGFGGTTLALVMPCAIHLKVMWKHIDWSIKAKDIVLIVFGVFATIFSTYISFRDLVTHLEEGQ